MASSTCGSTMSVNSHSNAGASSHARISRRRHAALSNSGMRSGSFGGCFALCRCDAAGKTAEADCALRVETEGDALTYLEVGQPPGLRQRHAELEAAAFLVEQHRGIGAVEQQALHLAVEHQVVGRHPVGGAFDARDFGPDEGGGGVAEIAGPCLPCAQHPAL